MKHTKNMIIKESAESNELVLFINNDYKTYTYHLQPVINTLKKHAAKGNYSPEKAIDAYYYVTTAAAKEYCKQYATAADAPRVFDVTARYTAAAALEEENRDEINES